MAKTSVDLLRPLCHRNKFARFEEPRAWRELTCSVVRLLQVHKNRPYSGAAVPAVDMRYRLLADKMRGLVKEEVVS